MNWNIVFWICMSVLIFTCLHIFWKVMSFEDFKETAFMRTSARASVVATMVMIMLFLLRAADIIEFGPGG